MSERKKVCIIGAGISGLISAKVLLDDKDKFEVTVFEKSSEFGGVWSRSRAYPNLCTNNAKYTFCFSDMPIPDHFDEYPTATQMLEYFTSWTNKHNLLPHIIFNAQVMKATQISSGASDQWEITTHVNGEETTTLFDNLIVATGLFETPFTPNFENVASFQGQVSHSAKIQDYNGVKNKRVLIVGNGKSAADMVSMCADHARSTLMIFREPHWMIPRYVGGKISTRFVLYGRWYNYIMSYYKLGFAQEIIQNWLKIPKAFWKTVGFCVTSDMELPKDHCLIPNKPLINDNNLAVAPPGYYESIQSGRTRVQRTEILRFVPNSKMVELKSGATEEFDAVIFATGYVQSFPFFDKDTTERFQIPQYCQSGRVRDASFRLYKSIVPTTGPKNVGFVGFQSSICNCTMYEIQARWLAEYFLENIELPSEAEREEEVEKYISFEKSMFAAPVGGSGYLVQLSYLHMVEDLLNDLKIRTTRTNNFIQEYFFPVYPSRFNIRSEIEKKRSSFPSSLPPPFYFSFLHFVAILLVLYTAWRVFV